MTNETKWPEHDKLRAVVDKSNAIGEFVEWLQYEKKVQFMHWIEIDEAEERRLRDTDEIALHFGKKGPTQAQVSFNFNITDLLGEFFNIDPKKLEAEKQDMMRCLQETKERKQK